MPISKPAQGRGADPQLSTKYFFVKVSVKNHDWNHDWNEDDQTIALFCEMFGCGCLLLSEKELAENVIGASVGSLRMMFDNFRFLKNGEGLEHYSNNQIKVFEKYSKTSKDKFKEIVECIISERNTSDINKKYKKLEREKKAEKERNAILKSLGKDPKKFKKIN